MEHKYWMFPSALPALKPNQSLSHSVTQPSVVECSAMEYVIMIVAPQLRSVEHYYRKDVAGCLMLGLRPNTHQLLLLLT